MGQRGNQNQDDEVFTGSAPAHDDRDFVPDFSSGVFRFPYRREPYARVVVHLTDGVTETRDAKVLARTGDSAFLNITFPGPDLRPVSLWIPSRRASRIPAEDSSWRDPYDLEWD